ncbi:MAG: LEVG family PEP-CTERM protein [Rivularia sp. (in: Bacteria)]|nr:LEVG family PEP-CTERM protein [Rivularia sp. MS3]
MRKFNVIAGILGLGLGFAAAAPAANAASLIPQQEGEIRLTNLDVLDENQAIDTSGLGFSVTSLEFDDVEAPGIEYGLSRLFIDDAATENNYGNGFIKFSTGDAGTNAGFGEYWLRAAAIELDENGNVDKASEGGKLEVGRFLFEFERELAEITLDFFDVESLGSGILEVNGQTVTDQMLAIGPDGNTQSLTLNNVNSLVLQLGNTNGVGSGDGVLISGVQAVQSVPEPTTTFSLGALAVAGMFGVKKRKNLKK